jgi:hypothetical protein
MQFYHVFFAVGLVIFYSITSPPYSYILNTFHLFAFVLCRRFLLHRFVGIFGIGAIRALSVLSFFVCSFSSCLFLVFVLAHAERGFLEKPKNLSFSLFCGVRKGGRICFLAEHVYSD